MIVSSDYYRKQIGGIRYNKRYYNMESTKTFEELLQDWHQFKITDNRYRFPFNPPVDAALMQENVKAYTKYADKQHTWGTGAEPTGIVTNFYELIFVGKDDTAKEDILNITRQWIEMELPQKELEIAFMITERDDFKSVFTGWLNSNSLTATYDILKDRWSIKKIKE